MVSKYIRISFNRKTPHSEIIEYGKWEVRGLTPEEEEERRQLNEDLMGYQDFSTAEDILDEERQTLMEKKRRLEALEALEKEGTITWSIQDRSEIDSVLMVLQLRHIPIYVENLPEELLKKILDPQVILNLAPGQKAEPLDEGVPHPREEPAEDSRVGAVHSAIRLIEGASNDGRLWIELVKLHDSNPAEGKHEGFVTEPNTIYILPIKYLKEDWGPINDAFKKAFGNRASWHRASKESHWKVTF